MSKIKTIGIIGFGVMGSAIGFNAAASGYKVIFKEVNEELVASMYREGISKPLEKKILKGKISKSDANNIANNVMGTDNIKDLSQCDLIIEAAIENLDSKIELFNELGKICSQETIIVSNTSTFMIEQLMINVPNPSRTAGLHYFFPANINRLVEIIRHKETSQETFDALIEFTERNKKLPIAVKDSPGFAVNPVFISSYMVLNSFYSKQYNAATLDYISKKALNVKFGIMWVQNGSGLSTCYHAALSMSHYLTDSDIGFPSMPLPLEERGSNNTPWNLKDGAISNDDEVINKVKDRLLGSIFTISTHLIEKKVVSKKDLEIGIKTALAWPKGPFAMMDEIGVEETNRLITLAVKNGYFKIPKNF